MHKVHDPEYVAARRILLDALQALGGHREAVVLVGAQPIYQHVGAGDLQVAPFTTDGDLALDPDVLEDEEEATIAGSCTILATELLASWESALANEP